MKWGSNSNTSLPRNAVKLYVCVFLVYDKGKARWYVCLIKVFEELSSVTRDGKALSIMVTHLSINTALGSFCHELGVKVKQNSSVLECRIFR